MYLTQVHTAIAIYQAYYLSNISGFNHSKMTQKRSQKSSPSQGRGFFQYIIAGVAVLSCF